MCWLYPSYNDPVDLTFWTLLDISLIPVDILRDLSRSLGSIYALLPDIDVRKADRHSQLTTPAAIPQILCVRECMKIRLHACSCFWSSFQPVRDKKAGIACGFLLHALPLSSMDKITWL